MIMERLVVLVQLGTLAVLLACFVTLLPPSSQREGEASPGRLIIHVDRMISESSRYDSVAPSLFLEMEVGGRTTRSSIGYRKRENVIKASFTFEAVDYQAILLFRIRDHEAYGELTVALFVVAAAEAANKTSVYKADGLNWIVMRLEWVNIKEPSDIVTP